MASDSEKQRDTQSEPAPKRISRRDFWAVSCSSAVMSSVFSFLAGPVYNGFVNKHFAETEQRTLAIRRAIETFIVEANAFQSIAMSYQLAITQDGVVNTDASRRLASNLLAQRQTLEEIRVRVPEEFRSQIDPYQNALNRLRQAMENVTTVETMRPFWERASDLLLARHELTESLQPLRT